MTDSTSCISFLLRVPRRKLVLFQGLLENAEGLGTMRTVDQEKGIVEIVSPSTQAEDLREFLDEIQKQIQWEREELSPHPEAII